jgi:hypothetical protein
MHISIGQGLGGGNEARPPWNNVVYAKSRKNWWAQLKTAGVQRRRRSTGALHDLGGDLYGNSSYNKDNRNVFMVMVPVRQFISIHHFVSFNFS